MRDGFILANGSVPAGAGFIQADILVQDGMIAEIDPAGRTAHGAAAGAMPGRGGAAAPVIDATGMRILPGFIDIHTHGGAGVDFNHASAADVAAVTRFFSSRGVTSYLPTVLSDSTETMKRQLSILTEPSVLEDSPQIAGIHLEGPFLCHRYKGAMPAEFLRGCSMSLFRELQEAARGNIRLVTLAPELEGAVPFIRELTASGVRVSIGHSAASYEQAIAAIEAGAAGATHVMNAMKLLHMHDPAILTAVLESDIYAEMICDGFHLHPPIVRLLLKAKGKDRLIAVTDSIMAAGLPDGNYVLGANDVVVSGGDARLAADGVRAGSTLTMDAAVRNIVAFTGLDLGAVSGIASVNPARMLGISGRTGSIEAGKRADLVLLDRDGSVAMTIAGGVVAWDAGIASGGTR